MNTQKTAVFVAIYLIIFSTYTAQADEGEPGWFINAGISYIQLDPNLPRDLINHTTHPDDQSFMSGSPGSTDLKKVDITFLNLSFGYSWPLETQIKYGKDWGIFYTVKIPVEKNGTEEKQNQNDPRPPTEGSFIYTEITEVNVQHEVGTNFMFWWEINGLRYTITPRLNIGYWQMSFEKGWNRFGRHQAEQYSDAKGISISPQLEASIGTYKFKLGIFAAYRAINLEYNTAVLGNSMAQGLEIGASVGWRF
jgi:hypothetical protein